MPSSVDLVCVDPSKIAEMWPHVAPLLRKAFDRTGFCLFSDLERDALDGKALVWIAWNGESIEAAAATALHPTDAGLVCAILACGGDNEANLHDWLPLLGIIERYAQAEGCKRMRLVGRKGWLKALDGYREKHVVLEKELT
jgi:hypothetical protein